MPEAQPLGRAASGFWLFLRLSLRVTIGQLGVALPDGRASDTVALLARIEAIADPRLGENITGRGRIRLDLLSQLTDEDA